MNINLTISKYQKHKKYNAFIIKPETLREYIMTIIGEIGDFIDIGFICLNKYNECKNCKYKEKILYYGFLKKDYLLEICFKTNNLDNNNQLVKIIDNNNNNIFVREEIINGRKCLGLPYNLDELFFSFYYLSKYAPQNKINCEEFYLQTGIN